MLQHPVPPHLLAQIGDITVSFALLESVTQTVVGSMLNEHQRIGQIITAELSFRNLRALLISLYLERHGEDNDFATLRTMMKRAAVLEEKRNQITHALWGAGMTADTVTRIKTTAKERHGIQFHFENVGEANLAAVATEMKQLAGDIHLFWIKLLEAGKASSNPPKKLWGSGAAPP